MGFCKFTKSGRPAGGQSRPPLRGEVGDAVPYNGSPYPSAGGDAHTSPRRTNAHFAAGHMGPALQGTPVMQDGTSGRRSLQRFIAPVRRGRCPHRPAGQMRILRRDRWVPPYRVHRSCRTGRRGRRPLQRFIAPIRRGMMPTHRPAGQMRILRRDTWVPPYRVRRSCRTGRRGRRPLQRFIAPVRRGTMPTHRPAGSTKRQAQAPASLSKKSGWTFSASWQAKSQNKKQYFILRFWSLRRVIGREREP